MPKPNSKSQAIRRANELMAGMSNAMIKRYCFEKWGIVVESNLIGEVLGTESSRRDSTEEAIQRTLTEKYLARIGDYRTAIRLLRNARKGG